MTVDSTSARIAIFVTYYAPGWRGGGPVRTVAEMVDTAPDSAEILIVTGDRDFGQTRPYTRAERAGAVRANEQIRYVRWGSLRDLVAAGRMVRRWRPDILVTNSFFSPWTSLFPLILHWIFGVGNELVIAPRGELYPGALGLKSRKKLVFIRLLRRIVRRSSVRWLATSGDEASHIQAIFEGAELVIAPDARGSAPVRSTSPSGPTARFVYVGRIARKKNLLSAIRSLRAAEGTGARFDIYGPVEDGEYWKECEEAIGRLPFGVTVSYCGEVDPSRVVAVFARYDAFLFPTLGENFGHVIHESLAAGCPVVVPDVTPWTSLIAAGGGHIISDDRPLETIVREIALLQPKDRQLSRDTVLESYRSWWAHRDRPSAIETLLAYQGKAQAL